MNFPSVNPGFMNPKLPQQSPFPILSPSAATTTFLADIPLKDRRTILASHNHYVEIAKQHRIDEEERRKTREADEQEELDIITMDPAYAAAVAAVNKVKNNTRISSGSSAMMTCSSSSLSSVNDDSEEQSSENSSSVGIKVYEPHVLRSSIYQKFVRQMEIFLNEQDLLGMVTMLFNPISGNNGCYLRSDHKSWRRIPIIALGGSESDKTTSSSSSGSEDDEIQTSAKRMKRSRTSTPSSANKKPSSLQRFRYELFNSRTFYNVNEVLANAELQMSIFPDALMVHGESKIHHLLSGETICITPYTFISTVLIKQEVVDRFPSLRHYCSKKSIATEHTTPPIVGKMECSLEGFSVQYYDKDNRITKLDSHVILPF